MGTRTLTARARLGNTARRHADDPQRVIEARTELAAAKIADYIDSVVAAAPPLTAEQRDQLATLLRPGAA